MVSFDFDPQSVACTAELRRRYGTSNRWRVEQGSALDREYLAGLGTFDVVYSWGVLHHTGDLWDALDAVSVLCAPGGLLFVALYNDQGIFSRLWTGVKRRYNRSGPTGRKVILGAVGGFLNARASLVDLVKRRTLRRGMDRQRDIVDWVGGWPFEVSTPAKIGSYCTERGFQAVKIEAVGRRMGNNQYLFRRA